MTTSLTNYLALEQIYKGIQKEVSSKAILLFATNPTSSSHPNPNPSIKLPISSQQDLVQSNTTTTTTTMHPSLITTLATLFATSTGLAIPLPSTPTTNAPTTKTPEPTIDPITGYTRPGHLWEHNWWWKIGNPFIADTDAKVEVEERQEDTADWNRVDLMVEGPYPEPIHMGEAGM
jgi:hypothetical protein